MKILNNYKTNLFDLLANSGINNRIPEDTKENKTGNVV
jgi:hypothetical protein